MPKFPPNGEIHLVSKRNYGNELIWKHTSHSYMEIKGEMLLDGSYGVIFFAYEALTTDWNIEE